MRRGLLYLGTENALYVSFDDGDELAAAAERTCRTRRCTGIVVQEHFNDLVIATYGRGFWILDDLTPLQQLTPQVLAADAHLFAAAAGVPLPRDHRAVDDLRRSDGRGESDSTAPAINYYLKAAASGPVTITILDASSKVVRTFPGTGRAGVNRVYWDLRGEPSLAATLRTSALYAPQFRPGPDGTRAGGAPGQITLLSPRATTP